MNSDRYRYELSKRLEDLSRLEPYVRIKLGDRELLLEYTNRSIRNIQKEMGLNLLMDSVGKEQLSNSDTLNTFLLIGLSKHQPDITPDELDDLISFKHIPYIMNRIMEALSLYFPDMSDLEDVESAPDPTKIKEVEIIG
jgi:hypothetical protein